mgnify:FL=1|jgi:hypothetical protein
MKELINNIFDKEVTAALDGFPSVYMKDEVVCVINRIRLEINELEHEKPSIDKEALGVMFDEVVMQLTRSLERNDNDYIDYSSAEFSVEYSNTIVVDSLDLNVDNITDSLESILEEVFYEALDVRE